ncbi:MAG: GWxTD domain-containing protein [Gemmatimonadales bacterium]|nr:GWxTD domain-containing protein [Gemmatimonadales bacterium]
MMMRRLALAVAGAAFGMLPAAIATAYAQGGPVVHTVRFYRAEHQHTRCKAFVAIPYALLEPAAGSPGMHLSYQVEVRIADSTGLTLHEETWSGRAPVAVGMTDAHALEVLEFPLAPGKYQLEVAVTDSVTGRRFATQTSLEAFSAGPVASDLLLSPEMRVATEADSVPGAGQILFGNTLVTPAVELVLTPLRTKAYYLLEAYAEEEASGTMAVAIMTETGQVVVRTPPTTVGVPSGGGVLKGQMDLAGLPEGSYQMRVSLTLGDQAVERTLPFRMQGMHAALVADSARRAAERVGDAGYFAAMGEAELDAAKEPLDYIAESKDNLKIYDDLSLQAKRRFLAEFWQRRDPTQGTDKNENREQFYAAIAYADLHFTEPGRRGREGWRTDRGRVFAKNGAPEDSLSRTRTGKAPPYSVWRYSSGKNRYYIFADRTGLGNYQLMHTNDLKEASRGGWQDIVTTEAVIDISRWLGIDFLREDRLNPEF